MRMDTRMEKAKTGIRAIPSAGGKRSCTLADSPVRQLPFHVLCNKKMRSFLCEAAYRQPISKHNFETSLQFWRVSSVVQGPYRCPSRIGHVLKESTVTL